MTETMSGATLQTLREALHLTRDDLAQAAGVQARTVKHWEHARMRVPADVAHLVRTWCAQVEALARGTVAQIDAALRATPGAEGAPVVLVRYRTEGDLRACWPDWPGAMPWGLHSAALARVLVQAGDGAAAPVALRWWDPVPYAQWRQAQGLADNALARSQWAASEREGDF